MTVDIKCPECNFTQKVPEETLPDNIRWIRCPRCNTTFEHISGDTGNNENPLDDISGQGESFVKSPREIDDTGYFGDLWLTFKAILFFPTDFFSRSGKERKLGESFAFGLLLGSLGAMFDIFWQFLLGSPLLIFMLKFLPEAANYNDPSVKDLILSPFIVVMLMLITAAVIHCSLLILRGVTRGFAGTFKACAYSNATSIFSLIPLIGSFVGAIWGLVILVIGLREIHETSTLRAVLALILPFLLLILMGIVLGFVAAFYYSSRLI